MRSLVAGCAGFIGAALAERLLADGHDVVGVDCLITGLRSNVGRLTRSERFEFLELDICGPIPMEGPFDWIFHLASPASPRDYDRFPLETLRANSLGTWQLLELAQRSGASFFLASTSEIYGVATVAPQPETYWGNVNPVGPRSPYSEAKRFAEALTTAFGAERGVPVRIGRLFNVYGPGMRLDDGRVTSEFFRQALLGSPLEIHGDGRQIRCLTYVDDAVSGILAIATHADSRPVNVGDPKGEVSVTELARHIAAISDSTTTARHVPSRPEDPLARVPDIARAQSLGWQPRTALEDGLRRTYAWFATGDGRWATMGT